MNEFVFIRHGESAFNLEERFTGWCDPELTDRGRVQAYEAGRSLRDNGFGFTLAFTSVLGRAEETAEILLAAMGGGVKLFRSHHLNERHYGALEGRSKEEAKAQFGEGQVRTWRRGYNCAPPALDRDDPRYRAMCADARYRKGGIAVPRTESTRDAVERLLPYWDAAILPAVEAGERVLVVAHGNILRGMVRHLTGIDESRMMEMEMPTAAPYVLDLVRTAAEWRGRAATRRAA